MIILLFFNSLESGSVLLREKAAEMFCTHNRLPLAALDNTDYWLDTHKLRIMVSNMENSNSRAQLEHIRNTVLDNLGKLGAAPGAAFSEKPPAQPLVHVSIICFCKLSRQSMRALDQWA